MSPKTSGKSGAYDKLVDIPIEGGQRPKSNVKITTVKIGGMMCSNCSQTIENGLRLLEGVNSSQVQLLLETATVSHSADVITAEKICEEVEDLGFDCSLINSMDEDCHADTAILKLYGKYMSKEEFELSGIISSINHGSRHYIVTYAVNLVGARAIFERAKWKDPSAEVETRDLPSGQGKKLLKPLLLCLPPAMVVFYLSMLAPQWQVEKLHFTIIPGLHFQTLLMFALATPVHFLGGKRFHVGAWRAIMNRNPNMEVLISAAVNVAYFYSVFMILFALIGTNFFGLVCDAPPPHFFEAPTSLICVMLFGKYIEGIAKSRTAKSLDALLALTPEVAHLKGSKDIPVALVGLGDELEVFPGETVPVDGILKSTDEVRVDESLLTGESVPVPKKKDDRLIGGSSLVTGHAVMVVDRLGSSSTLSQITGLIETAQQTKAPVQQTADAVAQVFVPVIFFIAGITLIIWSILVWTGYVIPEILYNHAANMKSAHIFKRCQECLFVLKFSLAVLLVACPCALGLATPTAVMVATSVAADNGILIKSVLPLENTKRIKVAVCDKTGTLTRGLPRIVQALFVSPKNPNPSEDSTDADADKVTKAWNTLVSDAPTHTVNSCITSRWAGKNNDINVTQKDAWVQNFWATVAIAESGSEHPLGKAVVAATKFSEPPPAPNKFQNIDRGVEATVKKCNLRLGSPTFTGEDKIPDELKEWSMEMEGYGNTIIYVTVNEQVIAGLAIEDNLAPGAMATVSALQARGIRVVMCTGDSKATAYEVARQLNIYPEDVYSQVLPQDKVEVVKKYQMNFGPTLMIGDGVNDAAALSQADVGVAIGCGAQITVSSADVVLSRSDVSDLLALTSLANSTIHTIYRNYAFSLVFNITLIPIASGVLYPVGVTLSPIVAGMCMAASSILVISSSLFLRNWTPAKSTYKAKPKIIGKSSNQSPPRKGSNSNKGRVSRVSIRSTIRSLNNMNNDLPTKWSTGRII